MLTPTSYKSVHIADADAMLDFDKCLPGNERPHWWMYRGTPRAFPLMTSLERAIRDAGEPLSNAPEIEQQMVKEFKRRAHFYVKVLPREGDILSWLALMQHHGAPTRLLDWTYSFYVAAFFALADAQSFPEDRREPAIVWALYRDAYKLAAQAPRANAVFEKAFAGHTPIEDLSRPDTDYLYDGLNAYLASLMETPELSVWAINPFRLNERLSVQKGVFLCPGHVGVPFEENLLDNIVSPKNLIRYEFSTEPRARREMLEALDGMNIGFTSLFPGLDGFARSLRQTAWLKYRLRPNAPSHHK